jgi:hypothetical protein
LDGVQAVAGLSILQFDTCFEGKIQCLQGLLIEQLAKLSNKTKQN